MSWANFAKIARQAVKHYPRVDHASKEQVKHLRRGWINSIQLMGDKLIRDVNYKFNPKHSFYRHVSKY